MENREQIAIMLQAAVMKIAEMLAKMLNVQEQVRRIEASGGERAARRLRRRALLHQAASQAWEETARDMLKESFDEQGVDLGALGLSMDDLHAMFHVGFRAAATEGDDAPAILGPLAWRRGRAPGRADAPETTPPAAPTDVSDYVLAYDESARAIVYAIGADEASMGLSWAWDGSAWHPRCRIPMAVPGDRAQLFQGFYDAARGGVACWSLARDPDDPDRLRPVGVVVGESAHAIEQRGDVPALPAESSFDFCAAFGCDPARGVTVMLGKQAVWELSAAGVWTRVCAVPEARAGTRWFSGNEGGVYDSRTQRVALYWVDWDDNAHQALAWDGATLHPVTTSGLPKRAFSRRGGAFATRPDGAVWVGGAGAGVHRLDGDGWTQIAETGGDGPNRFTQARAAWDPGRQTLMVGPGRHETATGHRKRQRVFYALSASASGAKTWTRYGARRVGTGTATAARWLAATDHGVFALAADWTLRVREPDMSWRELAPAAGEPDAASGRPAPVAWVGGGGALWAIADGGAVWRWRDGWAQVGEASAVFGHWRAPRVCYDPANARLIAWGGVRDGERLDETVIFSPARAGAAGGVGDDGASDRAMWRLAADAGSALGLDEVRGHRRRRRRRRRERPRTDVGYAMVYDRFLGRVTLYGDDEIGVLDGDRWRLGRPASRFSSVHSEQRLVVHDALSGETLIIDLDKRAALRCDLDGYTQVADLDEAGAQVDLPSPDRARPLEADWVYEPARRELLLYVDDDLDEHYALPLGEVFDHAAAKGPRTRLPAPMDPRVVEAAKAAGRLAAEPIPLELLAEVGITPDNVDAAQLHRVASAGWERTGPDALRAVCDAREIDLDALAAQHARAAQHALAAPRASADGADDSAAGAFDPSPYRPAFVAGAMDRLHERLTGAGDDAPANAPMEPLVWTRFGPPPPAVDIAAPPRMDKTEYALVWDEHDGDLVYIRWHGDGWGERWRFDGAVWTRSHAQTIDVGSVGQRFCGVYDPIRRGVVCWTTTGGYSEPRRVIGVISTADGTRPVTARGDIPALDEDECDRKHEVLFAFDRERRAHVAITGRGMWALGEDGAWVRQCTWPEDNPLAGKWQRSPIAGAAWDARHRRVVLWAVMAGESYGDERLCVLVQEGDALREIGVAGLPEPVYESYRRGPIFGAAGPHGVYALAGGLFRLGADAWEPVADGPPALGPLGDDAPPRAREAQMAYHADAGLFVLGPGEYASDAQGYFRAQHVFFSRTADGWRQHGVFQMGHERPFHIEHLGLVDALGPAAPAAPDANDDNKDDKKDDKKDDDKDGDKDGDNGDGAGDDGGSALVGLNRTAEVFVWSDAEAWRKRDAPWWTNYAESPALSYVEAGKLVVVSDQGGVYELTADAWRARPNVDRSAFGEQRMNVLLARDPDRDRALAWDCENSYEPHSHTLMLEAGAWRRLGGDDEPIPVEYAGDTIRFARFDLIYDGFLQTFLRIGPDQICALRDARWVPIAATLAQAQMTGQYRRAVYDAQTGQTLIVDFETRRIARLDVAEVSLLAGYHWPEGFVDPDPGSTLISFPFTPRCPYRADTRQLVVYDPSDHHGNYALALGPAFDRARELGPRTPLGPDESEDS